MADEKIIPPKSEWVSLSLAQLADVKTMLTDKYYAMRGINASFANQYMRFISELDSLIATKSMEQEDQY